VVAQRAVVGGDQHLGALVLKAVLQNDLVLGPPAQNGGGAAFRSLGTAPHGWDADAAAHQQIAALGLDGKTVAQHPHHVQGVPHLPLGQPAGAVPPDLKGDSDEVIGHVLLAGADRDGAAEQQPLAALYMDKLARSGIAGADHVSGLQHQIDGIAHLFPGNNGTFTFNFHGRHHLFIS